MNTSTETTVDRSGTISAPNAPRPTSPARRRLRRLRLRAAGVARLVWLRGSFLVLRTFAPRAAERLALDAWCTLPPGARHRYDARPEPGEIVRLPAPRSHGEIVAEVWGDPGDPVVYLVHGWGGWRGQLGAFVGPLREAGYRVVAVDAPGHGDADPGFMGPGRGTATEMIETFHTAVRAFGEPDGVVAHSLGTTVAMAALRDGIRARRLVLLSPNPAFAELLDTFADLLRTGGRVKARLRAQLEGITGRAIDDFDVVPAGADGTMPDALVVHDERDAETSHAVGAAVAATWPNARLLSTQGLGHYRILGDAQVVRAAVGHLVGADD